MRDLLGWHRREKVVALRLATAFRPITAVTMLALVTSDDISRMNDLSTFKVSTGNIRR